MNGSVPGVFRSLRSHNYRLWAAGALVSNVGTWMQGAAQDWLVLTELTHRSASALGIVMALQFGPMLLLLPWTGFAADHLNQRKLLVATQAAMGVLALALGVLTVTHVVALWHVYVFAFLFGCAAAFDAPVRQTFVAELVGDADLPNAVALNSASFNAAQMVGPAVAGVTIAAFGAGWSFLANGASFAAVLIALSRLRNAELRPNARASGAKGGFAAGTPICSIASRSGDDPGHAVPDRHVRPQLSDLHLDDGGRRLSRRRARLRTVVFGDGDRHGRWRAARGQPRAASVSPRCWSAPASSVWAARSPPSRPIIGRSPPRWLSSARPR